MNLLRLSILLLGVGVFSSAEACMNEYVPNVVAIERSRSVLDQLQKHTVAEPWDARRDRLRKALAAGGDYRVKNDLATALAHTGEAQEAVGLFEEIEAEKPGLYVTAANLGTAYELAGNDEKALEWIREGIKRNFRAHEGTEWLHVRILEAKIALKNNPKWLDENSVTGIEMAATPVVMAVGNRGESLTADQVKAALIYQLHERLQFVKPPDIVVGSLLLDLGDLVSREPSGMGGAHEVYQLASSYLKDLPNVESLQFAAGTQTENSSRYLHVHAMPPWYRNPVLITGLFVLVFVVGIILAFSIVVGKWVTRRSANATAPNKN